MSPLRRTMAFANSAIAVALGALVATSSSRAEELLAETIVLTPNVEGIAIPIPVRVNVSRPAGGGMTELRLQADLAGLNANLDAVINAIWQKQGLERQRVSHRGTQMVVDGPALRLKIHFRACPGALPSSNGSLVVVLRPVVVGDGVALSGNVTEFNVSNDLTRGAVRALRLDDRLKAELDRGLNEALAKPDAKLTIPAIARAFGARVTAANFVPPPPAPALRIEATMPNAAMAGVTRCLFQVSTCPE